MFGQMRGRRRREPAPPCPCGGVCNCHQPSKEKLFPWLYPICFPLAVSGIFPVLLVIILTHGACFSDKYPPRHIQIGDQDCLIDTVKGECNSTGACEFHDVAVCPPEKK